MKNARIAAHSMLARADYPGEVLTGVPVVELKGNAEAAVLCHRGVIAYDESRVVVASSLGPVTIQGEKLRIFRMNRERVVLQGKIRGVSLGEALC